jgi:ribosomal protein S18 acetylase RimI-like enzyme
MAATAIPSVYIRRANLSDLDMLVSADLAVDVEDSAGEVIEAESWNEVERTAHRAKIATYVLDDDKCTWVGVDVQSGQFVGMLMTWFRDRKTETRTEATEYLFHCIDESILPPDGRFVEVFQLWVHPEYRRRGLASQMKRECEVEARRQKIQMIYTHTRERNANVIELNLKLGYVEIRRGPIWDEYVRVSLVKWL